MKKRTKNMSFVSQMTLKSFFPDIISAVIIFLYSAISTQMTLSTALSALKFLILILVILQGIIAPITCRISYTSISKRLQHFEQTETTEKERTILLEDLMNYPFICAMITFFLFVLGSIGLDFFYKHLSSMTLNIRILCLIQCISGSVFSSLIAYKYCQNIATKYAVKIIEKGVNHKYVMQKKYFGITLNTQIITYICLPSFLSMLIDCVVLFSGYTPLTGGNIMEPEKLQMNRMILTCGLNSLIQTMLAVFFLRDFYKRTEKVTEILENMKFKNLEHKEFFPTDLSDEFAFNYYLTNKMISMFQGILAKTLEVGTKVKNSSLALTNIANETEAISVEQSAGTKEIVSTMENITKLSHNIEDRITEVTNIAGTTVSDVDKGFSILKENLTEMQSIVKANDSTIQEIKILNDRLGIIWEVVNMINSIADQTKIIAFNADLEAANADKEDSNFQNVANEIRRLANSIVSSTKEIKDTIQDIQVSSEELIKNSQRSTYEIKDSSKLITGLEDSLEKIKFSAEKNSLSAEEVKDLIYQQTTAFEQIVIKLQQISDSIQNFSFSTHTMIDTTIELKQIATNLESASKENIYE